MNNAIKESLTIIAVIAAVVVLILSGAWVGYCVCQQEAVDNGAAYFDENGKFEWFAVAQ